MSDSYEKESAFIYDPLIQYKNVYKDTHHQNASDYIDQLIKKSNVNIEENRETIKKIKKLQAESAEEAKQIRKVNNLITLFILLIFVSIGGAGYSIYQLTQGMQAFYYYLFIVLGVILLITSIMVIAKKLNPKVKELKMLKAKLDKEISDLIQVAWRQMEPLNLLFTYGMNTELFEKTIPQINLDKMFDSKRLDYLVNKFGLNAKNDKNRSTLYVQSGELHGNPFFIGNDLIHRLGTKRYTGSITITWTTTSTVNGKRVTQFHSQVLTAHVDKPCPYYNEQPYLVYGNEAAPDLSFSREDSDAEILSEKKLDRMVNKDIKKLEKLSEKSTKRGENYTVMANSEFEVLWGAKNRNNEVQFRLLFTPLAQKQLLELMKDKEIAYGDDFDFTKQKMINYVFPEHLSTFKFDISPEYFHGYDVDVIKENFVQYNDEYLKNVYFAFAPILAIPLYQQMKPHEYIYKDLYKSYVSFYEHERVVNMMNESEFKHPLSKTRNILKTSVVKSGDFRDTIKVTAYGYETQDRIDYITVFGGDGRSHQVPVHWVEYLPVENATDVAINVVQETKEESYADRFKSMLENLKDGKVSKENLYMVSSFIAFTIKK